MCSPNTQCLTPTPAYIWLFSFCSRCDSPSHIPLLSVFKCIFPSKMQTSASDSSYQPSISLNSWKISLDLFFGASMFDLHNHSTGFDQHCPLDPNKSYRWVLLVKAFVYMLRTSVYVHFFHHCMCLFDVWHCRVCLISCKRMTVELWCLQSGCLCNVRASQLHLTAFET